jgi:hypothetical protein
MSAFRLDRDTMTPELRRLAREVKRPRTLMEAGAKAVQKEIVAHLRRLESRGNEMGWPSQKFFSGGPDSVEHRVGIAKLDDRGAIVTIADPRFVHRIEGGRVTAKRRKFLTIPLRAEAYALAGKGSLKESAPWLVLRFPFLGKVAPGTFEKWFVLVPAVTHRPHPNEMPDRAELGRLAGQAMLKAARILLRARGK